ncbi:MAG TPA: dihydropteroate synthase [Blastocatellia bacterium]|nr:dihydropteroate synthase [Blastocatellia bacterium]
MRKLFDIELKDGRTIALGHRTAVVGVLNITPDSFSDGGVNFDAGRAIDNGLRMEGEGADIIEVGGESTRPGAAVVSVEEELSRVLPVVRGLVRKIRVPISVDTYKSQVARVVIDEGASLLNDVSALRFDPLIADVAAHGRLPLVLMHMRGEPATMQKIAPAPDIFSEIERDIAAAAKEAERRGVARKQIIFDPGIGFGKTLDQNLAILNRLDRFETLGLPIMIGTSRKSFIGRLTGRPENDRVFGTAASVSSAIIRGAHIVRVHDVKEMVEVARVTDAIINATDEADAAEGSKDK